MPRRRKELSQTDQLLDELLQQYTTPEEILGEQGLLKQLTKRLMERALSAELTHHLNQEIHLSLRKSLESLIIP